MPLSVSLTPISPTCPMGTNTCNGSISAAVTGNTGSPSFQYYKNGVPFATTQNIYNLCAANYRIVVNDSVSTTGGYAPATAESVLTAPAAINAHATIVNPTCAIDGSITLAPAGGTSPYTYLWNNSATTNSITGLNTGTYSVTITDAHGCKATFSFVVNSFVPFTVLVESKLEKCFEGEIELTALPSNGTAPYTYLWSTTKTIPTIQANAGTTYTVTVTDANGCEATTQVTAPTQIQSYLCCLADKLYQYGLKLQNGLKVCKCEKIKNLLLSVLIDVYDNFTSTQVDQQQLGIGSTLGFGAVGGNFFIAQSFIPQFDNIVAVMIKPTTSTGAYSGTAILSITDDSGGNPNNLLVSSDDISASYWNANANTPIIIPVTLPKLTIGNKYWVVLNTSVTNANHPNISINPTGTYGAIKKDTGSGWQNVSGSFTFQVLTEADTECLTDDKKQVVRDQLTNSCGCCGCEDLPQTQIT